MSEHDLQSSVFHWVEMNKARLPELANYFAIPNGGKRPIRTAIKMKKEGQQKGVPDTFLAIPSLYHHGLFIEHKWGKGVLSEEQKTWKSKLQNYGYLYLVSRSPEESQNILTSYIGNL